MEVLHVSPEELARTVAALANSDGGGCVVMDDPAAISAALGRIVPRPQIVGQDEPSSPHGAFVRPAEVAIGATGAGVVVSVVSGTSLCTVDGAVYVFDDGAIRALTLAEVVGRAGSGG